MIHCLFIVRLHPVAVIPREAALTPSTMYKTWLLCFWLDRRRLLLCYLVANYSDVPNMWWRNPLKCFLIVFNSWHDDNDAGFAPGQTQWTFCRTKTRSFICKPKCVKRKIRRGAKSCFPSRALATFQVEGVASSLIMSCFFLSSRGVRRAVGSNPPDETQHLEVNYAFVLTHK